VRGATLAADNSRDAILAATRELLQALIDANGIAPEDVASVIFTMTPDLTAVYPAFAARQLGWIDVALLSMQEIAPPDSLPRCIRVLIHWNTTRSQKDIRHVYMNGAEVLRPDRAMSQINSASSS
jgi:chorismate mutase